MKIILLLTLFSGSVGAKTLTTETLRLEFHNDRLQHTYVVQKKSQQSVLIFQNKSKKTQSKILTPQQAQFLQEEGVRIYWQNQFRKPAHTANCTAYADITVADGKSHVCVENKKALGMSYGLLNLLNSYF